ncbi:UNVERIFIED_CONTAM: hypothetical protein FKN15_029407 [Acipenser sinensis]
MKLTVIVRSGSCSSRKGLNGACSVHEYTGSFMGQSVRFKMTSVCGHVMSLDFIGKYNNWDKVDPAELFSTAPTEKKEANPKLNMVKFLQVNTFVEGTEATCSCSSRKGLNGACSVHEYTGSFMGQSVRFKMTSVCGHVMSLDFIGKYNNWDKVDPAELFSTAPTEKKEANPKLNMVKFLQASSSMLSTGCTPVLDAIQPVMNKAYCNESTVFRAKFSSITDTDICNAMNHLGEPNRNEALSVDARQELDLRIGCAFTRFQTKYFQGKYGNLDSALVSFGPCQTPTLGFCVERHDKITSFKPEPYWVVQTKVSRGKDVSLTLDWDRVRVFDREVAQMFLNIVKTAREARVESVSKKEKAKQRPQALNTVEMLRVASSALGFTEVMPWQSIPEEESLPVCERGDVFTVDEVKLLEKHTSPPDYLTEAELITLMEKHGIGTDASIPVHINNICQRNYVTVESGRRLKPTNLGIVLVHGYYKTDAELVLPTIRSAVEKQLNLIAQGKANFKQVLQFTLDIFKRKFHYFVDSIASMDELMEVSFSPIAATGKPLSRCGKCHRFMKYIQVHGGIRHFQLLSSALVLGYLT